MNTFAGKSLSFFASLLLLVAIAFPKEPPPQIMTWPATGTPILRFSFARFKEVGSLGKQHSYLIDSAVENLWDKKITSATFSLYMFDNEKARIGEGWITVTDLGPGQTSKFQTSVGASGNPESIEITPRALPAELRPLAPPRMVSITINSVPQGAVLKVDGADTGTTPKIAKLAIGKHALDFHMEGFNDGTMPMEIGPDDASGGSVSYELGASAHDTLELRDGTVLTGDLESVSATDVVVRVGGTNQHFERNKIKRILLVQREPAKR